MNKAELLGMKEGRLADFAVAFFLGAPLVGQAAELSGGWQGTTKLLIVMVHDYSWLVIFTFMWAPFFLSLFLAAASMATRLQRWGLAATRIASPIMLPLLSVPFILSWVSSDLELPQQDQATSGRRTAVVRTLS